MTIGGSNSSSGIGIPIEEAVQALHPPRVGRLSSAASQIGNDNKQTRNARAPLHARSSLHNLDVSSHHVSAEGGTAGGGGTTGGGSAGGGGGGGSSRFSQLLLEHGEKHLQDWAVLAASSPRQLPPSMLHHQASTAAGNGKSKRRKNGGKRHR